MNLDQAGGKSDERPPQYPSKEAFVASMKQQKPDTVTTADWTGAMSEIWEKEHSARKEFDGHPERRGRNSRAGHREGKDPAAGRGEKAQGRKPVHAGGLRDFHLPGRDRAAQAFGRRSLPPHRATATSTTA